LRDRSSRHQRDASNEDELDPSKQQCTSHGRLPVMREPG